jgi:hypothetical protein
MSTELHPDFPVVTGNVVMTKGWRINLPEGFNRRIEDGSLVLWRPELTFWINVWNNDAKASVDELLTRLRGQAHPDRRDEQLERSDALVRLTYALAEADEAAEGEEPAANSINGFIIAAAGYVQISAYYDSAPARALADEVIRSVRADEPTP